MTRAVYIGGFGNGKTLARGVGGALVEGGHYEDEDHFTLSWAIDNPEKVARAVDGVDVLTHSAGLLAVRGTKPKTIRAVGAPLPSSIPNLMYCAAKKTARMTGHSLTGLDSFKAVNSYNGSSIGELTLHPVGNLKLLRQISNTDAIDFAKSAKVAGIPTWLIYNEHDDFFPIREREHVLAGAVGISLEMIPGQHDQLPLYPADTLNQIYK